MKNEKTAELLKLVAENPELPIIPQVDGEIVGDDSCLWWIGSFGCSVVAEYAAYNERFYEEYEKNELEEEYYCRNEDKYAGMSEEEIDADVKKNTDAMWKKAILVRICLPD